MSSTRQLLYSSCWHCSISTQVVFLIAPFNLLCSCYRQEAFKRAVSNAKSKAQCISQTIGVQLGAALEVIEISQDEFHNHDSRSGTEVDPNTPRVSPSKLQQRLNSQDLTYTSQVSVIFEAQPLRCCSHRKCHKH